MAGICQTSPAVPNFQEKKQPGQIQRGPLSDLAARFTDNRSNNFDIYLPNWLAQHNKVIFGTLFVAGESVVLQCWFRQKFATSSRQANTASHGGPQ